MQIHDVEPNSQEWLDLHIGIPTSSAFKQLVTPAKGIPSKSVEPYARQLAVDKYAGEFSLDSWEGNKWTERGHEYEDAARAWYELMFEDRVVTQVGFITNDAGTAGSSPDSLVDDDGCLEIKCLKAANHMEIIEDHRLGKPLTDYIMQCQGELLIAERAWCDLLFYHPTIPPLVVRRTPDFKIQAALEVQIEVVLALRDTHISVMEDMAA